MPLEQFQYFRSWTKNSVLLVEYFSLSTDKPLDFGNKSQNILYYWHIALQDHCLGTLFNIINKN